MHTAKSLKDKKKNSYHFYTENTKNQKYILACILALITSLLEPWELGQYFKKNILFSFSIWDYEFIRKTYSWFWKDSFFYIDIRTDRLLPDKIRIFLQRKTFLKL